MGDQSIESIQKPTANKSISHTILQSLQLFNRVAKDDTKSINSKFLSMNQWFRDFNNTITNTQNKNYMISPDKLKVVIENLKEDSIIEDENEQLSLSSPHRFETTLPGSNQNSVILDSETTGKQELFITANPSPVIQKTPKNIQKITNNIHNSGHGSISKIKENEIVVKSNFETAISSWSPVKVEHTLKNVQTLDEEEQEKEIIPNHQQAIQPNDSNEEVPDTSNNTIIPKVNKDKSNDYQPSFTNKGENNTKQENGFPQENVISDNTIKENTKVENSDIKNIEIDNLSKNNTDRNFTSPNVKKPVNDQSFVLHNPKSKVSIRTNMFEPLPEKDPLIVKNSTPSQKITSKSHNTTFRFQNLNKNVNLPTVTNSHTLFKTNLSFSKRSLSPSMNNKYKSIMTPKEKSNYMNTFHRNKHNIGNKVSPQTVNKVVVSPLKKHADGNIIKKENKKVIRSPISRLTTKTPQRIQSVSTKPGAVFDRLSSIPTKSFEQKIRSKTGQTPIARKFAPSSIDVTGSPIRRVSPKLKKTKMSEILEQEALSSIFFKNKSQNKNSPSKQENLVSNNKKTISPASKTLESKLIKTNKGFESLIPKLTQDTSLEKTKEPLKNNLLVSKSLLSKDTSKILADNIKSPSKSNNSYETRTLVNAPQISTLKITSTLSSDIPAMSPTASESNKLKNTLVNSISLSSLNPNEKLSTTKNNNSSKINSNRKLAFENTKEDKVLGKLNVNSSSNETKQKDPTEKIQLIPLIDESKVDVKVKLNKRLSEVIRTQQEQEKKRRENQQKRKKSHLEEESGRKHSRYSTYRIYSKKHSLGTSTATDTFVKTIINSKNSKVIKNGITTIKNDNDSIVDTNNILGDIHKVDYRNIIGDGNFIATDKSTQAQELNSIEEDSLPEILSDDEQNRLALTEWAHSPALENQLKIQKHWDPRRIFGPIAPLHIDEIFPTSSSSRLNKVKSKLTKKPSWKH